MSILNLDTLHENQLQAAGELNPHAPHTRLHFPSGQTVVIPTALLFDTSPASLSASTTPEAAPPLSTPEALQGGAAPDHATIPLVEEQLEVTKRVVEKEHVRITRKTEEFLQHVSMPLTDIDWQVERVTIGEVVKQRPEPRQQGDTMIFPLVEERLVLQRELFLREEVHVRRVATTVEQSTDVLLKRDVLQEERVALTHE